MKTRHSKYSFALTDHHEVRTNLNDKKVFLKVCIDVF